MQEVKSDTAIPKLSCNNTTFLPSTSGSQEHDNSNPSTPENRLICTENQLGIATQSRNNSALLHANYPNKMSICATSNAIQEKFNDFDVVWAKMKGYPWWPALFFWTKQALQEAGFTSCFSTAFDYIRISEAKQSDSDFPKECLVLFLDKFNFSVLSYLPGETIRPFTGTYDSTLEKCLKDLKMKRFLSKRRLFFIAMKKAELLVHSNKMESAEDWNLLMELKLSESLQAVPVEFEDKLGRAARKESQSRRIKRKRDASSMAIKPENIKMQVCSTAEVMCATMEKQVDVKPVCLRIENESALKTKIEPAVIVAEPDDFQAGMAPLSSTWTLDAAQNSYYKCQDVVWDSKVYIETWNHNLAETKSASTVKHARNGREDGRAYRKQASRLQQLRQALQSGDLNPHTMIQCTAYTDKNGDRDAGEPPFRVVVHPDAVFVCDLHAHLATCEIIGFLAGRWVEESKTLYIQAAFPCRSLIVDGDDGSTDVEMDPESELLVRDIITQVELEVVGWYHSHPTFAPDPSVRDIENQTSYQHLFQRGCQLPDTSSCLPTGMEKAVNQSWTSVEPFVGLIVGTYDTTRSDPVSLFRYFHTRADDCSSSCTKTQSVCLPYEFIPSIPVHCSVLAEEDRQGLLHATMYPSVYRDLFPFQQLHLVPSVQQNDELSPAKKILKGNPSVKRTKPNESKKSQLGKRQPKRNLLLPNSKLPVAKKVRRRLQQSKKPEIENEAMTEVSRAPNIVTSSVKDDMQAAFEGVDANQTQNPFSEESSQKKSESERVHGQTSMISVDAVSEAAAHRHEQSVDLKLNGKAIKKAFGDLVGAVHNRDCDSEIDTEASDNMHEPERSPICGKSPKQSTDSPMEHLAEKMNTANITRRRRNRKASRPMKRLIDPVTPSISNPAEPRFVVFDEESYQKASSTVHSDPDAENGSTEKPLDGTCKSSISRTEIPLIEDDSPQRPARPDTNETAPTTQPGSAPAPSSNSQPPLQHNSTREAGNHPNISPADRKSSTDISHERDQVDGRRPQRRSSAKYGSQLGLLNDMRNQLLRSLRTVYGERIQSCVEQVVALIDYYCKFDRRTELHQIWKARLTKIQKLEISLTENVKKLNLPVELRVAFVKDVIAYLSVSWDAHDLRSMPPTNTLDS